MAMLSLKRLLLYTLLISSPFTYSCEDLLPTNKKAIIATVYPINIKSEGGVVTNPRQIMSFPITQYANCTLDCRCTYDTKDNIWKAKSTNSFETCVFEKQCMQCKKTDKKCEIYFPTYDNYFYTETFFQDFPDKKEIKKCYLYQSFLYIKKTKCDLVDIAPSYDDIKPINLQ